MTLEELGARLREKRMERGFSVEDIAIRLKVPPRVLRAIEEGDRAELPHTVYIRSFVKSSGTLLGIDAEELAGMLAVLDESGAVPQPIRPKGMMESQLDGEKGHGAGLLFKLLLIALIGVGGYVYYTSTYREEMPSVLRFGTERPAHPEAADLGTRDDSVPGEESPQTSGASGVADSVTENPWGEPVTPQISGEEAVSQAAPIGEISPEPAPLPEVASLSDESSLPAENPAAVGNMESSGNGANAGNSASAAREERVPAAETAPAATASAERWMLRSPQGTQHKIVVTAREDCWLSASADADAARKGGTLPKGETFTAEFKDRLTLRLGNAGGVDLYYDGVKQTAPGKRGGVMTLTFPPR